MENSQIHLMIIWSAGLSLKEKIIADLNNDFEILNIFNFNWQKSTFHHNLKKFYAHSQKHLDEESYDNLIDNKINHCGTGEFLAVVFEDLNPKMKERLTSSGKSIVNINVFEKKVNYRKLLQGGHQVHASDNKFESNKDIALLFGCSLKDFKTKYPKKEGIQEFSRNVLGVPCWNNLEELFFALDNTIDYVILRNFESIPKSYQVEGHGDIDLLVEDINYIKYLTGAKNIFPNTPNRVYHEIEFLDRKVPFDFRFIGDDYYDKKWELNILKNKVYDKKGFYKPSQVDHFYSLLYHAYVQKPNIAEDYKVKLKEFSKKLSINYNPSNDESVVELLNHFMTTNSYNYTIPIDSTVFFNKIFIKQLKLSFEDNSDKLIASSVNRSYDSAFVTEVFEFDDYFLKVATSPIPENENKFLNILHQYPYFPKCDSFMSKGLLSEIKILRITGASFDTLNENKLFWELKNVKEFIAHCLDLLIILAKNGISHRDIRPANIIIHKVNDKFIPVLIDFGWGALIEDNSPTTPIGLGHVFKHKEDGFSDAYSMGLILELYFGRFKFAKQLINDLKNISPKEYNEVRLLQQKFSVIKIDYFKECKKSKIIARLSIFIKKYRVLKKIIILRKFLLHQK